MGALSRIPIVQVALVISIVTALAWIALPTTPGLLVSVVATGVLAWRGFSEDDERDRDG